MSRTTIEPHSIPVFWYGSKRKRCLCLFSCSIFWGNITDTVDNSMAYSRHPSINTWRAHLDCRTPVLQWFSNFLESALYYYPREHLGVRIFGESIWLSWDQKDQKDIPLRFSQQFEVQLSLPDKGFHVECSLPCRFVDFRVEATARAFREEWLSVEVRVCPTDFLYINSTKHFQASLTGRLFTGGSPLNSSPRYNGRPSWRLSVSYWGIFHPLKWIWLETLLR